MSSSLYHSLFAFTKKKKKPPALVFSLLDLLLVAANSSPPTKSLLPIEILRTSYSRCSFILIVVGRINAHSHAKCVTKIIHIAFLAFLPMNNYKLAFIILTSKSVNLRVILEPCFAESFHSHRISSG